VVAECTISLECEVLPLACDILDIFPIEESLELSIPLISHIAIIILINVHKLFEFLPVGPQQLLILRRWNPLRIRRFNLLQILLRHGVMLNPIYFIRAFDVETHLVLQHLAFFRFRSHYVVRLVTFLHQTR
jgi:hypothetical protein